MKTTQRMINGVDVGRLQETIGTIQQNPGLAIFRFRATNRWDSGGHSRTHIHDFFGAGQGNRHEHDFNVDTDEPELLLGTDKGANPVEFVLTALAGCLTTTLVYHAAAQGVQIHAIESELEGELDLRGFLGLDEEIRSGYRSICVNLRIDSDASQETLNELVQMAQKHSPVFDMISNPVNLAVKASKAGHSMH